jgi:Fe2+ transport system protein FeoA
MHLSDLKIGDHAKIVKIDADSSLKQRLHSFGIVKGAIVTLVAKSLTKDTLQILVNCTDIGLRKSESDKIIVELVESNNE